MNRATEIAHQLDMEGKQGVVDCRIVRDLMKETDLEVLGVLYAFITEASERVTPSLEFDETFDFVLMYYTRCLKDDVTRREWASTRYTAGRDLVNWFAALFNDPSVPRPYLSKLKGWMGELYREGNQDLRTCLVTATLEHLFEQGKIRRFFEDWKSDPVLTVAYEEALEWVTHGGSTPLGKSRWFKKASS